MKDLKIYIFIASALLVVYIVAQYNRPKDTDWSNTLSNTDKIPFGTYILYNQLHDIFPNAAVKTFGEPVYNVISDERVKDGAYIIICNNVQLNKYDYKQLVGYIKQGNDVFIAANEFGEEFRKKLGVNTSTENNRGVSATRIGFLNPAIRDNKYDVDKNNSDGYFDDFDASKAIALGNNQFDHYTYLKFPMGKGNLFLNANPGMFTNYSLLQDMGLKYASIALSYIHNNKNIWWDTYYTKGRSGSDSNMRVFINHPQLRWAFYISFFSLLAFVLYEMKRRQRIIPVIAPLSNTTVDFTTVVGQVYYEQRNNGNIAQKKASYFLEHIRSQYNIRTNVFDEDFIVLLSQKSGAEKELIRQLTQQIIHINVSSKIGDNELINLNRNIEQFYLQSS
jgi:hypothetical protein